MNVAEYAAREAQRASRIGFSRPHPLRVFNREGKQVGTARSLMEAVAILAPNAPAEAVPSSVGGLMTDEHGPYYWLDLD